MSARVRLALYIVAFLVGLNGVHWLHHQSERMQTADYANVILDHGFEEIDQ